MRLIAAMFLAVICAVPALAAPLDPPIDCDQVREADRADCERANEGEPAAITTIARRLLVGLGTDLDFPQAIRLLRLAAAAGHAPAIALLGDHYAFARAGNDRDDVAAMALYRWASALGDMRARAQLGHAIALGLGAPANPAEGVRLLREAVAAGHAIGLINLAALHESGTGVPADREEARRLYREAAATGDYEGQNGLAWFIAVHGGDLDEAQRAARAAVDQAPQDCTVLDTLGTVMLRRNDMNAAREWLEQASQLCPQYPGFAARLAQAYEGLGMKESMIEALQRVLDLDEALDDELTDRAGIRRRMEGN